MKTDSQNKDHNRAAIQIENYCKFGKEVYIFTSTVQGVK